MAEREPPIPGHAELVFCEQSIEHFYRADRARARTGGGSGIGLAVVKQLVEAHGGRVWAESRPREGTTFGFVLPAADPGTPETARPRNDEGWSQNGSAR